MKKYIYMAVAAIAALSSCSSDNDLLSGEKALTFTATMEGANATRATYNSTEKCAQWEAGDQISINGKTYNAQSAGLTTTFTAEGEEAGEAPYNAYFACTYDGTTATLPAQVSETWADGKFNMPMYATSTTTNLQFKNLCGVLKITVKSDQIAAVKAIKVSSANKAVSGAFTVTDNAAVLSDAENVANTLTATYEDAVATTEGGKVFFVAVPAQTYQQLKIQLSADGTNFTKSMTTKSGTNITVERKKIYPITFADNAPATTGTAEAIIDGIPVDVNWVQLWAGGPKFAEYNVGVTDGKAESYGGYYAWGGSQDKVDDHNTGTDALKKDTDTAYQLWGSNWRMPTNAELDDLLANCNVEWIRVNGVNGRKFTGKGDFASNSVFLPAAGNCYDGEVFLQGDYGNYWSSSPISSYSAYSLDFDSGYQDVSGGSHSRGYSVRAVLAEKPESTTTGTAKATIGGSEVDVNWVQLWAGGPKFAEFNVGAANNKAEDYGGYYAWGGSQDKVDDHNTGTVNLKDDADTATKLWGSAWRMPRQDELEALLTNCDVAWTTVNGVNGRKFTGKGNFASNSVFLPAAGYCIGGNVDDQGDYGNYWSSTPNGIGSAFLLYIDSRDQFVASDGRYYGYSVRAVLAEGQSDQTFRIKEDQGYTEETW